MQIAELTQTRSRHFDAPHWVTDQAKLDALTSSMEEDGWVGAPLLVDGEQALTGSHRTEAARRADLQEIPYVEVADLCDTHAIDWADLLDEHGDWYRAGIALADLLPADVVAELGLDLH